MKPPSLLPLTDMEALQVFDGLDVASPEFCKQSIATRSMCSSHYQEAATRPEGYAECPFGFTTKGFTFEGKKWFVSGVVAHPRFGSVTEREIAKRFPASRVSRESVDVVTSFSAELQRAKADAIVEASKVLPQAFHELRKLNGAVIQHAERVIAENGEIRGVMSIKGAAELMRNNFDILEALSNIEGMKSLPLDSTVNLFDLAFKMKRVYQERASSRSISIHVNGVRAIIRGSQKSFPLVPAVLIENAIKYGEEGEHINITIEAFGDRAVLCVENLSHHQIDPIRCFERGARFANNVEGGGFGLFLAREVVAAHRGVIRCEEHNGLVRMLVELPLQTVISYPG